MEWSEEQTKMLETARNRRGFQNMFSIKELSLFLSVPVRTIQRRITQGMGPPRIKRSHRMTYPLPSLLEWLDSSDNCFRKRENAAETSGLPEIHPATQASTAY
jgi:hypothetical protein